VLDPRRREAERYECRWRVRRALGDVGTTTVLIRPFTATHTGLDFAGQAGVKPHSRVAMMAVASGDVMTGMTSKSTRSFHWLIH
jgi:hypothetical protein